MKADLQLALIYVNACMGVSHESPQALVMPWDLQQTRHSYIEFRVQKMRFHSGDTQREVLTRMSDTLGHPTRSFSHPMKQTYEWDISDTQTVCMVWIRNVGTFIRLHDARENRK